MHYRMPPKQNNSPAYFHLFLTLLVFPYDATLDCSFCCHCNDVFFDSICCRCNAQRVQQLNIVMLTHVLLVCALSDKMHVSQETHTVVNSEGEHQPLLLLGTYLNLLIFNYFCCFGLVPSKATS